MLGAINGDIVGSPYEFNNIKTTFIMRKLNFNLSITFIGGFVTFFISVLLSVLFCIYSHHGGDNINGRLIMEIWPLVICMTTVIWGINCFLIFKNKHSACPLTRVKRIAFIIMSIVVLLPSFVFNDCFLSTVSFRSISSFNDWYGVFIEKWIFVCVGVLYVYLMHMALLVFLFSLKPEIPYLPKQTTLAIIFIGLFCFSHAVFTFCVAIITAVMSEGHYFYTSYDLFFLRNQCKILLQSALPAFVYAIICIWCINRTHGHRM